MTNLVAPPIHMMTNEWIPISAGMTNPVQPIPWNADVSPMAASAFQIRYPGEGRDALPARSPARVVYSP